MLDPRGDTGVYLLYMYARLQSIFEKGGYTPESIREMAKTEKISLDHDAERALGMNVLMLPEYIEDALKDNQINKICFMLYDVATRIGSFYTSCKVLGTEEEKSRIMLLESTRLAMKTMFDILGMKTLNKI